MLLTSILVHTPLLSYYFSWTIFNDHLASLLAPSSIELTVRLHGVPHAFLHSQLTTGLCCHRCLICLVDSTTYSGTPYSSFSFFFPSLPLSHHRVALFHLLHPFDTAFYFNLRSNCPHLLPSLNHNNGSRHLSQEGPHLLDGLLQAQPQRRQKVG